MTYTIPLEFPWSMTYFLQQASGLLAHITVGELKIPVYICFDFLCFLFVSTRLVIYKNISFSQSLNHKGGEEVCGCGREGKMWGFLSILFYEEGGFYLNKYINMELSGKDKSDNRTFTVFCESSDIRAQSYSLCSFLMPCQVSISQSK